MVVTSQSNNNNKTTDEGYIVKAGFLKPNADYTRVNFITPFKTKCIGVVVCQNTANGESTWNTAARDFDREGFVLVAYNGERQDGLSWIAFGY